MSESNTDMQLVPTSPPVPKLKKDTAMPSQNNPFAAITSEELAKLVSTAIRGGSYRKFLCNEELDVSLRTLKKRHHALLLRFHDDKKTTTSEEEEEEGEQDDGLDFTIEELCSAWDQLETFEKGKRDATASDGSSKTLFTRT